MKFFLFTISDSECYWMCCISEVYNVFLIPTSGEVTSHNYPGNYGNQRDDYVLLEVPFGQVVNVTFTHFDLELDPDCEKDYVEVG